MKKEYMKPAMQVVMLQQQHIICISPGAMGLNNSNNSEGFNWNDDGFADTDDPTKRFLLNTASHTSCIG